MCAFDFSEGFEKDVPSVGDGKVEEMYKAIAISWQSLAFVCSPACRKLARYVKGGKDDIKQEDGGNTGIIPQHDVESQPVKKPRGRPKGSKKTTVLTGGTASLEKTVPGLAKPLVLGEV
ncbi:hypothetical protein HGM15179_013313 [Zosterops borbonicus]|uniref:Uncharacterized protein n=1 Tax=Zosterops borbonicus TaxID=364589 RepID=A0A8K1G896_9PASS|nr:hypothetical protein HGM15179_013313 [Zosterops borbonicus]